MALNKNHQAKIDLMNAYDMADRNTPRDQIGRARYGMGAGGLPRTPAQQAAVKKAAKASAQARGQRAALSRREPKGASGVTSAPAPGVSTGSLSLAKKPKGILL
jgi:hypothetical protein